MYYKVSSMGGCSKYYTLKSRQAATFVISSQYSPTGFVSPLNITQTKQTFHLKKKKTHTPDLYQ